MQKPIPEGPKIVTFAENNPAGLLQFLQVLFKVLS